MFCNTLTKVLYLKYLQFWFYLNLCKTKIFLSSCPHCDGNSYADKLKNPHMRKSQQKLKNQLAGNRPLKRNWKWIIQREYEQANMKYRLRKFPLIHLPLPFVRKNVFYSKNIQYAYNFYGTDLNVWRGILRTQSNIYGGASLPKSQKSFIVDARLGSKYVSGIGFK